MTSVHISRDILMWICQVMRLASVGVGGIRRKWRKSQQAYEYFIFQNFDSQGLFIRIVAMQGRRRSQIILPEFKENSGWADLADRILKIDDKRINQSHVSMRFLQKSFVDTTIVPKWNDSDISLNADSTAAVMKVDSKSLVQRRKYMNTCLLATVEGSVDHNFNTPEFKVWARKSWKLSSELNIVEIGNGKCLLEFLSETEAARIAIGEWRWKGRNHYVNKEVVSK